jgi:23S rRNA pseudouridine1911/1915/1917 synthase
MNRKPRTDNREPKTERRPKDSRDPREVTILYEDEAVIALNKPAGLAAVPVKGTGVQSALALLQEQMKAAGRRAYVVHRIDRFTSGILLFAKTERDRHKLVEQFLAHTPVREYLAVVRGHFADDSAKLIHYFKLQGMHQKLVRSNDKRAARAELTYTVERRLRDASLLRINLITGLQNQIRVQFSVIGHPVVGDRKYHPEEANEKRIDRVALHASRLEFKHPRTGKAVVIECPPPMDFEKLLKALPH